MGKALARLEQRLGVRLLNRSTRRISLTDEGALFYERGQRIVAEVQEAEAELARISDKPRGRLRVSLPAIGYRMLLPILPEFSARYPDIELDLDFNDRLIDVIAEGVDAVIRSGELPDSQLKSRNLGPSALCWSAPPATSPGAAPRARPGIWSSMPACATSSPAAACCSNGACACPTEPRRWCWAVP
ncbi:hypothetical protein PBOI14_37010 [Pseudomonas sp. Boi14]|nr:hypothetical protein PBOI14_37010 [Pseudomonas sp. Boi14]